MKRIIVLASLVLVFANITSAQGSRALRLDAALQAFIQTFEGIKGVEFAPAVRTQIQTFTVGQVPETSNPFDGLDALLTSTPFVWQLRSADRMVEIKLRDARPATTTVATTRPSNQSAAVTTTTAPSAADLGCPQVRYNEPGVTPDSPDPIKRMLWWRNVGYPCQRWQRFDEQQIIGQLNSMAYRTPAVYPVYAGAAPVYGRGYGYTGGYLPYWMMKGCTTGPMGYLKFKYDGPEEERKLWQVTFNNWIMGSIDQGDSHHNRLELCAADYIVVAKKRGQGESEPMNYTVRPHALTEVTVGNFLLPKEEEK